MSRVYRMMVRRADGTVVERNRAGDTEAEAIADVMAPADVEDIPLMTVMSVVLLSGRAVLRQDIASQWDPGDVFGSAMMALGGLCDVLWHLDETDEISDSAGYRPGMGGPDMDNDTAREILDSYESGHIDVAAMAYWAGVLSRYIDALPESERY